MRNNPLVVGVTGCSGSGKSWFCQKLIEVVSVPVTVFPLDCYYRDPEWVNALEFTYDNPQALDLHQAFLDFHALVNGNSLSVPIYNYKTHQRTGHRELKSSPLILLEGLFFLHEKQFRPYIDCCVWMDTEISYCLNRRVKRDLIERGRTEEYTLRQFQQAVQPGYEQFILPNKQECDLIINNNSSEYSLKAIDILCSYIHEKLLL